MEAKAEEENVYLDTCAQIQEAYGSWDPDTKIDKLYKKLQMQNNRL